MPSEPTDEDLLASAMEVEPQGECFVAENHAHLIICDHE